MSFYICKVTFDDGVSESGASKTQKVQYLVEALSTSEVEIKMATFLKDTARDSEVTAITKSQIAEIVK